VDEEEEEHEKAAKCYSCCVCVCVCIVVVVVCVYFLQFLPAHAHSCWIIGLYSASSVDAPPITAHRTHTRAHTYSNSHSHTQTQRQTKASKATSTTTATATRRIIVLPKERAFNVCDTLPPTTSQLTVRAKRIDN